MADDNNRPRRPGPLRNYREESDDNVDNASSHPAPPQRGQPRTRPAPNPTPAPAPALVPAPVGPGARVAAAVARYRPTGNPQALPPPRVPMNVLGTLPRLPNGNYPDRRTDLNDLANMCKYQVLAYL